VTEALPKTLRTGRTKPLGQAAWKAAGAVHPDPKRAPAAGSAWLIRAGPNVNRQPAQGTLRDGPDSTRFVRFQRCREERALPGPALTTPRLRCSRFLEKADQGGRRQQGRPRPRSFLERAWAWKAGSGGTMG